MENKRKKRSVQNKGQERRGRYCSSYHRKYIEQSRGEERRGEERKEEERSGEKRRG